MPSKSKDAVISELKKELEAMRLQDQATKSELSKVSMELKHKNTVVKDLQVMFSGVVQFHVGTRQRKKKHGKAGLINVADKATRDVLDRLMMTTIAMVRTIDWLITYRYKIYYRTKLQNTPDYPNTPHDCRRDYKRPRGQRRKFTCLRQARPEVQITIPTPHICC